MFVENKIQKQLSVHEFKMRQLPLLFFQLGHLFLYFIYPCMYFHIFIWQCKTNFEMFPFFGSYMYIVSFRLRAWMHNICNANISWNLKYFVYNCIGRLDHTISANDRVNLTFIVIKHIVLRKMTLRTCHSVNSFFSVDTGVRNMAGAKSSTS